MGHSQSKFVTSNIDIVDRQTKHAKHVKRQSMDTSQIFQALEYLSNILWRRTRTHHTFIVSGKAVSVLFFRSRTSVETINILPTTAPNDPGLRSILLDATRKCSAKFLLPPLWLSEHILFHGVTSHNNGDIENRATEVIAHSLDQNIIVYTSDGLSLLAVDIMYELKSQLQAYSEKLSKDLDGTEDDMNEIVEFLRRLVMVENHGQNILRVNIDGRYPYLLCSDEAWEQLSRAYTDKFGEQGILLDIEADRI